MNNLIENAINTPNDSATELLYTKYYLTVDKFTNLFKLFAYFLDKGSSWPPECLPEVCLK